MKNRSKFIVLLFLFSLNALYAQNYSWKKVSGGVFYTVALRSDATLWSWGSNEMGQLGIIKPEFQILPVQIGNDSDWTDVDAGDYYSVALKKDGSLWRWGEWPDWSSPGKSAVPVKVNNDSDWIAISAGSSAAYALKKNGTIWAWGNNIYLGNEFNLRSKARPAILDTITNCVKISAGYNNLMAITKDSILWGIGGNISGESGNGNTRDSTSRFKKVVGGGLWIEVSAGNGFTLGLQKNGSLWAWGSNDFGKLGIGDTSIHLIGTPIQIGKDKNWKKISAGSNHAFAITTDNELFGWGKNKYGQLGDGTNTAHFTPVKIGNDTNWQDIEAVKSNIIMFPLKDDDYIFCGDFSFGIKSPGDKICAAGLNDSGQLGINSTNSINYFNCNVGLVNAEIKENKVNSNTFIIFPNPTYGEINIKFNDGTFSKNPTIIKLKTISGQLIYSSTYLAETENYKLDCQDLPKGVYFLEGINNHNCITQKIVHN